MLAKMYSKQNYFVSRSEKWYNFGKRFHKIKQNQVSESAISLLRKDPRETKLKKKKKLVHIHRSFIHNSHELETSENR